MRAPELPTEHAACVAQQCVVRPGGALTHAEQREDAGLADGECLDAVDCPGVTLTAFPSGVVDRRGAELCPVCPRPGVPAVDEAARIDRLADVCPRRQCAADPVAFCADRACHVPPPRAPRVPVAVSPLPPEPEAPPELPELDTDALARCNTDGDCHVVDVCGAHVVMSRLQEQRSIDERRPCAFYADNPEAPPVAACVEHVCGTADDRAARAEIRAAQRALGPAHAAWERAVAKVLAVRAAHDELEPGHEAGDGG